MNFKKIMLPFAAGVLALGLAACNDEEEATTEETPEEETVQEDGPTEEQQAAADEMQAKLAEQKVDEDTVVAIVNDEELTGVEYNNALTSIQGQMQQIGQDPTSEEVAEQVKTQAIDTLVNQTLILQQANEADMTASQEEIDQEYATFQEQFGGEEAMNQALEAQGMDVETLKEQIAESIKFEKYISEVAPSEEVTEEDIQAYYDEAVAQNEEAETGQEIPPLEEVSETIKQQLETQQQQEFIAQHIEELKEDAAIEVMI